MTCRLSDSSRRDSQKTLRDHVAREDGETFRARQVEVLTVDALPYSRLGIRGKNSRTTVILNFDSRVLPLLVVGHPLPIYESGCHQPQTENDSRPASTNYETCRSTSHSPTATRLSAFSFFLQFHQSPPVWQCTGTLIHHGQAPISLWLASKLNSTRSVRGLGTEVITLKHMWQIDFRIQVAIVGVIHEGRQRQLRLRSQTPGSDSRGVPRVDLTDA